MKKRWQLSLVLAVTLPLLASCGAQSQSKSSSTKKTLNLMQTSDLTTLDSTNQATLPEFSTLVNTTEGLYRLNHKDQPVAAMATKVVKPTKNGTQYVFHIRKQAKWSNGDPVLASDFEYAWKRAMNPANKPVYTYIFSGIKNADKINAGKLSYKTLGIKATGKRTLKITLDHPMKSFNKLVTVPVFMPQDQKFVQKVGTKAYGTTAANTVSNGAFRITGWTGTNDTYTLKRNKYYYDQKAIKLNQIKYTTVKDANTAHNLFADNKLDDATITGVTAKSLQNDKSVKHVSKAWTYYLQVNQRSGQPLKNRKLREALSLVINRQQLTKNILADGSKPASSFVSPGTATDPTTGKDFSTETSYSTKVNIAKAKKLWAAGLKEAKIKGTVNLKIVGDDQDVTKNVAQFVQKQIEQHLTHVNVAIKNVPDKGLQTLKSSGSFSLSQWYWLADFADPINYLGVLQTGNTMNSGHFSDRQYDKLVNAAKKTNNTKQYWRYLRQAERRLQSQAGIIPLYYVNETHLVNQKLAGVDYHSGGQADYTRAYFN
ncbi:peptide ABC transporter substrate-binding protein [Lactiplantibacillus daowaiensis]|uniref:Peptide ABC transporter substrate-binding protein n=1 Tax=Lactiplantibacillus daowaiensis TaxID=2559918 RepID=A0ABW1S1E9_9LACO|nr:peptide ABC transporter substrate-binding protein [Lactiplantibacillus daowaiensis]